ncbi:MAG TPA: inner membrane CreD family protein [Candidatus Xenobia bacterium]|nr:inner membrane CreD family protein [Candidatus Xenobia bacterium]
MTKRIAGILFIFFCTSAAWGILGATILARTFDADTRLRGRVASSWGAPHEQRPPTATYEKLVPTTVRETTGNTTTVRTVQESVATPLPLERSRVRAALDLEHRRKGLLWYSTYKVDFAGAYTFRNPTDKAQEVTFRFSYPAEQTIYDNLAVTLDDKPLATQNEKTALVAMAPLAAGQAATLKVSYLSQGLDTWKYNFGDDVAQVRDFELLMTTNFKDIDFPANTLSPSEKRETPDGWELAWRYQNLVSGYQIGMAMPEKLQPGPLAGRISFFAPVSLLFFFFLLFLITTLRGIDVHPMNYFFLACAFFSFHLLLAYLVDHISIHAAFVISSAVSIFLVVSYLRLVVGMRFALLEAGLIQLVYLVLFSYTFFLEGYTGLSITIGSILTLFVVMQMTGRVRWSERFAAKSTPTS